MGKVLIVYASRANETQAIAELIAEGVRISGHEADVKKTSQIKSEDDLKGYDGYAFGSATYHGEMISSMKQILFMINDVANPKKKKVDVSLTRPPKSLREKNV